MMQFRFAASLLSITFALATARAQVPTVVSDFEPGSTQGWSHAGASAFLAPATGGNPNGYLHIDNSEGPVTYIFAPVAYRGDLRSYRGGSFAFDGRMIGTGGSPWTSGLDYGHVWIVNGAQQMVADLAIGPPPTASFQTFSMPLQPANWGVSSAVFDAILANVTEIRISVEALFGNEVQAIDNVILAPGANPASATPIGAGCDGDVLAVTALPWIGTTFQATASGFGSPAFAIAAYGIAPLVPPVPLSSLLPEGVAGCDLHVVPTATETLFSTSGSATTQLVVPPVPGLAGATFVLQVVPVLVDAGQNVLVVTSTNAFLLTVGSY